MGNTVEAKEVCPMGPLELDRFHDVRWDTFSLRLLPMSVEKLSKDAVNRI